MKQIDYIFPIYNESGNIARLYQEMRAVLAQRPDLAYRLIFVNDGSKDDSLLLLRDLQKQDKRVTVIDFSRNFGHQMAVTAGLDHSDGAAAIIMDSDLQDPPAVSLELIAKWEEGYEVVYAQRRSRQDGLFKKLSADLFYRLLQRLADIDIPRNTGDFRLIDRQVVEEMQKFREHNRFLRGMVSYVGFRQIAVPFDRQERHAGETGYPLHKMLKFAADGIFSFSSYPLRLIRNSGLLIAGLSLAGIGYALVMRVFFPQITVSGWTLMIIVILFMGGAQMVTLGIVGDYIGRIYTESQQRPLYIIKRIYQ